MARIVPSQVVNVIDQMLPQAKDQPDSKEKRFSISRDRETSVAAIIDLIEQIPSELFVLPNDQYLELISSVAALKSTLKTWKLRDYGLEKIPGLGNRNPISLIRNALASCPDEFPPTGSTELSFIADLELKRNLEIDISATNKALSNGEWKAATVLAGSVVEALLLWAVSKRETIAVSESVSRLIKQNIFTKDPGKILENWSLHSFIEVAADIKIIKPETAQQARLAKEFRNLIHAGREVRLKQKCDRGTALSAVAAVEHVVRDISI